MNIKKQKSEFLCDTKFINTLPDPPLEPKLVEMQLPDDRLTKYCLASLERAHKHPLLCEKFLGIPIDMIDQERYKAVVSEDKESTMDPKDAALFQGQTLLSGTESRGARGKILEGTTFNWLERNNYLQNNLYDIVKKKTISERVLINIQLQKLKINQS